MLFKVRAALYVALVPSLVVIPLVRSAVESEKFCQFKAFLFFQLFEYQLFGVVPISILQLL